MAVRVVEHHFKQHLAWLKSVSALRGYVGVFADGKGARTYDTGMSVVDIAFIHEVGAPTAGIPRRSFLESTATRTQYQFAASLHTLLLSAARTHSSALEAFARALERVRVHIQEVISDPSGPPPPNAPLTIRRKGFDNPLFETGTLADSIEVKIAEPL